MESNTVNRIGSTFILHRLAQHKSGYSVEMTFGARCILIAGLVCGTLSAQDITGRWAGVADTTDEGATKRQEQQSFEVTMTDGKTHGRHDRQGR